MVKIWFHVIDWPEQYKTMQPKPPNRLVGGILLYTASQSEEFDEFIISDRNKQDAIGSTKLVSEERIMLRNNVPAIYTVRTVNGVDMRIHYLYFPSPRSGEIFGIMHSEKTGKGFMVHAQDEELALREYFRIKQSLKVVK
jgi:hypothetical protein